MENISDFLKNARIEYNKDVFDISTADADPVMQFAIWFQMAIDMNVNEPHAMNLATVSATGKPSSRVVLLRNFDSQGFVFFTNYQSHKGRELDTTKFAALNFFWPELHKQVRIEGVASKVDDWDSEDYFRSRPRESQLGAWVSEQSRELASREELDQKLENLTRQFEGKEVSRPPHWGGYRVKPDLFEFWQGRPSRLHDRLQYRLGADNNWSLQRLYP